MPKILGNNILKVEVANTEHPTFNEPGHMINTRIPTKDIRRLGNVLVLLIIGY